MRCHRAGKEEALKASLPRRRLIPKWRPVAITLSKTEAHSTRVRNQRSLETPRDELNLAIAEWRSSKSPGMLGEVLSFSVHGELREQVIAAGYEALRDGSRVTEVQEQLIHSLGKASTTAATSSAVPIETGSSSHPFQEPIRRLRGLLRLAPDNPLALLDFAQLQAAVGKLDSAERALKTALVLSPNNRTVLRSAATIFRARRSTGPRTTSSSVDIREQPKTRG